ncbi:dienelactone hydrolase family protein [Desulfobacter postgatei]|uniref:dienelactone hydrolase family protein n=1 Tax=Desulfobacter postgatei TaxID=2293 RepID=UPI00259B2027|nr:dienelactone hydrolase family protein [uncultured Desulfobacter sp.]
MVLLIHDWDGLSDYESNAPACWRTWAIPSLPWICSGSGSGQRKSNTKGWILVMHGTADKVVSMDAFAALAKQLDSDEVKHEMITYRFVLHAFTVFGSQRYQEEAEKDSWKRFADFLEMQLKQ